jgi:hypothetical protein
VAEPAGDGELIRVEDGPAVGPLVADGRPVGEGVRVGEAAAVGKGFSVGMVSIVLDTVGVQVDGGVLVDDGFGS